MTWHFKHFNDLTTDELYAVLQLRSKVFVVEQDCPYQDLDDKDKKAVHVFTRDPSGNVVAYARLLPPNISYLEHSIGRVATDPSVRKAGYGRALMREAINYMQAKWLADTIRISAQEYLLNFYQSFGFVPTSEVYLEDNIPHVEMLWSGNA